MTLRPALTLALLSASSLLAADKDKDSSSTTDSKASWKITSNRGPENPELKFNLPPPPILTPEQELKTL